MRHRTVSMSLLLLLGIGLLAGCGQKGPLFLQPTKPVMPAPASANTVATPAAAASIAAPAASAPGN
jgi:predicted small lipoprotein YifL